MKRLIAALSFALATAGATSVALADAAALAKKHCATCHGADGKAKTKMGEKLGAKDWSSEDVQKKDDAAIKKQITEGSKDPATGKEKMPGFASKLKPEEVDEMVKYVRTFKPAK